MFDYFYGQSGEMFSYFRVPKILFRDIKFKDLSTDAKTLYGILLDRMGLSVKNGWLDEQGRVYIIFPVQEVMDALGCADIAISMGWQQPDELPVTLSTLMAKAMNDQCIPLGEGILHHVEGVDLIPVQAQYLSAKGLEQLLQTIQKVRRQINPKLKIEGILMTMTDSRTNYGREIDALIRQVYGSKIRVFEQPIPHSVRTAEISAVGKSIFQHDPKGKVAEAYKSLTREVMANAEKQLKRVAERGR